MKMKNITTLLLCFCITLSLTAFSFGKTTAKTPDFASMNTKDKKASFVAFLVPKIKAENKVALKSRQKLLELERLNKKKRELSSSDVKWLEEKALRYKLKNFSPKNDEHWKILKRRINKVPPSLILAQAANESAWGTSRFARKGNNYFGQWCYVKGCGLVPKKRTKGASHEVASFKNAQESVARYIHNLNTNNAYDAFRHIRTTSNDALDMASGLVRYSSRKNKYVSDIKSLMKQQGFLSFDK